MKRAVILILCLLLVPLALASSNLYLQDSLQIQLDLNGKLNLISEGSQAEVSKFFSLVRKISPFVIQAVSAEGFNIGVNCGVTAGQTVFHAHVHIMPRQTGDGHGSWQGKDYKAGECEQVAEKIRSLMVV